MLFKNGNGSEPGSVGPPVTPGGISSAYGATVFGRGGGPEDTIRQSLKENEIEMPSVAGPAAKEVTPHDQLTQLVSGFINGLVEHVVRRVVSELQPKLADRWMLSVLDYKLRREQRTQEMERAEIDAYRDAQIKTADVAWNRVEAEWKRLHAEAARLGVALNVVDAATDAAVEDQDDES